MMSKYLYKTFQRRFLSRGIISSYDLNPEIDPFNWISLLLYEHNIFKNLTKSMITTHDLFKNDPENKEYFNDLKSILQIYKLYRGKMHVYKEDKILIGILRENEHNMWYEFLDRFESDHEDVKMHTAILGVNPHNIDETELYQHIKSFNAHIHFEETFAFPFIRYQASEDTNKKISHAMNLYNIEQHNDIHECLELYNYINNKYSMELLPSKKLMNQYN